MPMAWITAFIREMISQATGILVSQMIQRRINHNELSMVEQEGRRIERLALFKVKFLSDHKIGAIVSIAKLCAK